MNSYYKQPTIDLSDLLINLLEKAYVDYLLLVRIIYKVKNQFRRQKQFKYLIELKNFLHKNIFENFIEVIRNEENNKNKTTSDYNNYSLILKNIQEIRKENFNKSIQLIIRQGCIIKEMLKLKLYIPYSLILLGTLSRLFMIFDFILEKEIEIKKSIEIKIAKIINLKLKI